MGIILSNYRVALYISDAFKVHTGGTVNVINLDTYGITGKTQDHIIFKVRTCHDANIMLAPTPDFPFLMYDIFLAGWNNTRCIIRTAKSDKNIVDSHDEKNIVSCTEFRDFWVSWTDNHIKSGKGLVVGQDILVAYDDSNSPTYGVNFIGISTGWGASGIWLFNGNEQLYNVNTTTR